MVRSGPGKTQLAVSVKPSLQSAPQLTDSTLLMSFASPYVDLHTPLRAWMCAGEPQVAQRWCDNRESNVDDDTKHNDGLVVKTHYDVFIAASTHQGLGLADQQLGEQVPHESTGNNYYKVQPGNKQVLPQEGGGR